MAWARLQGVCAPRRDFLAAAGLAGGVRGNIASMRSSEQAHRVRGASSALARRAALAALPALLAMLGLGAGARAAVPPAPGASTLGVSSVSASSAVLHGAVNSKGQITSYTFQYGTTVAYGAQTPPASAGSASATIHVSQALTGLQPYTTYHYRILASGPGGVTAGGGRTFTTAKVPLSLQIAGVPNPVPFREPFAVQGTLSGTGAAGRAVALQINPFPYLGGFKTYGNPELTSTSGSFSFPVLGLLENAQLRVVTTASPHLSSPVVLEGVAVRVTLHARRVQRRRRGLYVRFSGTISPAEVGASVGIQWLRPGAPSLNQGGTFASFAGTGSSRFGTVVRIRHRGLYEALVVVKDGSHVSAYSAAVRIR